ncbi:DUF4241 domain-containing protein [Phycicoccus flavus]|uniref:DUF4241 domain-containing protein n=1 Tax=Phycicoccus flavus TaxID=2502783 RepID=UPI000FEB64FB|nr:DUF4241 domain-containing protein [Phycicoccus flavus]NHA66554.1 DUF4241 domain-containing protein [Phycicoccus flavus]
MATSPELLVAYGRTFTFPEREGGRAATAELVAVPGPEVTLRSGDVLLLDAWSPDFWPQDAQVRLSPGRHPTTLGVVHLPDPDGAIWPVGCAAVLGRADLVAAWRTLVVDGEPFRADVGTGLGAVADAAAIDALRVLADDDDHMATVMDATPQGSDRLTAMEVGDGVAAVAFAPSQGSWTYPVHVGLDDEGRSVAVLVDVDWLEESNLVDSDHPATATGDAPR